jgi:hypothetical protein
VAFVHLSHLVDQAGDLLVLALVREVITFFGGKQFPGQGVIEVEKVFGAELTVLALVLLLDLLFHLLLLLLALLLLRLLHLRLHLEVHLVSLPVSDWRVCAPMYRVSVLQRGDELYIMTEYREGKACLFIPD